ncbi:MAG: hypothetical protein KGL39_10175 [Patescibacteria group bacterium]|nr:hypothetical protein [Patescibacteria group bacterium]
MPVDVLHQISAQANFIQSVLYDYASSNGGDCQVVSNMKDMWMQANQSSQKPTIYITWIGESPWSSNANISAVTHRVSRDWKVGIKRGRGFQPIRGTTLSKTTSVIPFFDVVEDVRDLIRSELGISEDAGIDDVKVSEWQLGGLVMDGKLISFTTKNDLPTILNQPDNIPN